jgi:hypothetical protein
VAVAVAVAAVAVAVAVAVVVAVAVAVVITVGRGYDRRPGPRMTTTDRIRLDAQHEHEKACLSEPGFARRSQTRGRVWRGRSAARGWQDVCWRVPRARANLFRVPIDRVGGGGLCPP